jgi:small subunit ribosomal protein S8
MSMQDPIADMLTRIRNAQMIGKKKVQMGWSTLKEAIAVVMKDEGYIAAFEVKKDEGHPSLTLDLKYYKGKPVIESIQRVSRPSVRVYRSFDDLPISKAGLGIMIVTTSKGVMTGKKAAKLNLGGEVLCEVS